MKKLRNIAIFLILIVSLPILFFSAFEISRINKNEKELLIIYNKQLEAILFSINLYSEDILNSWATKVNESINNNNIGITEVLSENPQIQSISLANMDGSGLKINTGSKVDSDLNASIQSIIADSARRLSRLATYYRGGYRKIEPLGLNSKQSAVLSFFLIGEPDSAQFVILEIDAQKFIRELLGPKIQATAENKMSIGIVEKTSNQNIYRIGDMEVMQAQKPLWLFPQYAIGISLRDQDLSALSKEKNRFTLFMILLADSLFIIAGILAFLNIRKEIRLAQIKSDFISNVSHEIRTPLALISMYAETLEMGRIQNEQKKKEYYSIILGEAQRLSGIVNRILNFSKIENGKRTYNFSTFDLNELVEKVMHSYTFHLNSKGFELKTQLSQAKIQVNADAEAISDAFINLLDNAIKYSTTDKQIEINTGILNGMGYIEVIDNGIGIATEHHKLIFDKFFRVAKGNLAYTAKGTGLGLTIVKNIVEAHHGKIELKSKLDEGSTFRILLPIN